MASYIQEQIDNAKYDVTYNERYILHYEDKLALAKARVEKLIEIKQSNADSIYSDIKTYDRTFRDGFEVIYASTLDDIVNALDGNFRSRDVEVMMKDIGIKNSYRGADKLLRQMKRRNTASYSKETHLWSKVDV